MEDLGDIFDSDSDDSEAEYSKFRKEKWIQQRINWGKHISQLLHDKTTAYVTPILAVEYNKKQVSITITIEMIMVFGIRYLAGERVANDRYIFRFNYAEAYHYINEFFC